MYVKSIPYHDFKGRPKNDTIHLNLTEREVFKLLEELQTVFDWRDSLRDNPRELDTGEVVAFYNNLEKILLDSWGIPSEDGQYFRKAGRYEFEESALFNATMVLFVTDPTEASKMLDGILPKGMEDMVRKADASLAKAANEAKDEESREEIEALRARIGVLESTARTAEETA